MSEAFSEARSRVGGRTLAEDSAKIGTHPRLTIFNVGANYLPSSGILDWSQILYGDAVIDFMPTAGVALPVCRMTIDESTGEPPDDNVYTVWCNSSTLAPELKAVDLGQIDGVAKGDFRVRAHGQQLGVGFPDYYYRLRVGIHVLIEPRE